MRREDAMPVAAARRGLVFGLTLALFVLGPQLAGSAQDAGGSPSPAGATPSPDPTPAATPFRTPFPTPFPTPPPTAPPPSETATPSSPAAPAEPVAPSPLPSPAGSPAAAAKAATPAPAPAPDIPVLARTRPRDTTELVTELEPLTEWGLSLEQVLVEGMGRFPVAASARYSDDWLAARYNPEFHLHRGLDIMAEFGSPIRAPDAGVVTRFSDSPAGGIGVWMKGHDDTRYYFAHMGSRSEDLRVGGSVELGTVLGYVGNTGNASGGPPHLHFEVHRNGDEVPPKPIVDRWLDEAELAAGDFIEIRRVEIELERAAALLGANDDLGEVMLQMVLDPVGGSISFLHQVGLPE